MVSLLFSVATFLVAGYFIKRYFDSSGLPKSKTLNLVIFVLALAVAYTVSLVVDWIAY